VSQFFELIHDLDRHPAMRQSALISPLAAAKKPQLLPQISAKSRAILG
jgi:hypothetical protein